MAAKKKVTFHIDEDLLRAVRARATRDGRRESEIVADALHAHLGFGVFEQVWARSDLSEDEAIRLGTSEQHALRDERGAARG